MSFLAVALVLISTLAHAAWNKRVSDPDHAGPTLILRMLKAILWVGFLPAVAGLMLTGWLSPIAWVCVLISGIFCGFYFNGLAKSYGGSHFTIIYPMVWAIPVLLVAAVDAGRGFYPTTAAWIGIVLIAVGCVLSPLDRLLVSPVELFRTLFTRAHVYILLAAVGTLMYTLSDKYAAVTLQQGYAAAATYGYFFFLFAALTYLTIPKWKWFNIDIHENDTTSRLALSSYAIALFAAYSLVLWAYQLAEHASYVISLRTFSIVIGVAWGLRREPRFVWLVRITAALLIVSGILLISLLGAVHA